MPALPGPFGDPDYSDVTLLYPSGRQVQAHRNILSGRSEYFLDLFKGELRGVQGAVVTLEDDFSEEILDDVFFFFYQGTLREPPLTATAEEYYGRMKELLDAAGYFQCAALAASVIGLFCTNFQIFDVENMTNCARALQQCDEELVGDFAVEIANACKNHIEDLLKIEAFEEMLEEHPKIGFEIVKITSLPPTYEENLF